MSTKCPRCGLTNFSDAVVCKKCNARLASGKPSKDSYQPGQKRPGKADVAADGPPPPRTLGILLAVLGGALALGGLSLLVMSGASPYFLVAGIGIACSGALIATGKRLGLYLYFATFALMFVWSLVETGGELGIMMSRLVVPALIGAYLLTEKVRSPLR